MTVEVTSTIAGLNSTYPVTGDPLSQGDDHIRLLKSVLKAQFVNVPAIWDVQALIARVTALEVANVVLSGSLASNFVQYVSPGNVTISGTLNAAVVNSTTNITAGGNITAAGTLTANIVIGGSVRATTTMRANKYRSWGASSTMSVNGNITAYDGSLGN